MPCDAGVLQRPCKYSLSLPYYCYWNDNTALLNGRAAGKIARNALLCSVLQQRTDYDFSQEHRSRSRCERPGCYMMLANRLETDSGPGKPLVVQAGLLHTLHVYL